MPSPEELRRSADFYDEAASDVEDDLHDHLTRTMKWIKDLHAKAAGMREEATRLEEGNEISQ